MQRPPRPASPPRVPSPPCAPAAIAQRSAAPPPRVPPAIVQRSAAPSSPRVPPVPPAVVQRSAAPSSPRVPAPCGGHTAAPAAVQPQRAPAARAAPAVPAPCGGHLASPSIQPKLGGVVQPTRTLTLQVPTTRVATGGGGGPPDPNPGGTTITDDGGPPRHLVLRLRRPPDDDLPRGQEVGGLDVRTLSYDDISERLLDDNDPLLEAALLREQRSQEQQYTGLLLLTMLGMLQDPQPRGRTAPDTTNNRRARRARIHGHRLGGYANPATLSDEMLAHYLSNGSLANDPLLEAAFLREQRRRKQQSQVAPPLTTTGGTVGGNGFDAFSIEQMEKALKKVDGGGAKINVSRAGQINAMRRALAARIQRNAEAQQRLEVLLRRAERACKIFAHEPHLVIHTCLKKLELFLADAITHRCCLEAEGEAGDRLEELSRWFLKLLGSTSLVVFDGKRLTIPEALEHLWQLTSKKGIEFKKQRQQEAEDLHRRFKKLCSSEQPLDDAESLRLIIFDAQVLYEQLTKKPKAKVEESKREDVVIPSDMSPKEAQDLLPCDAGNALELVNAILKGLEARHTGFTVRGYAVLHSSRGASWGGWTVFWIVVGSTYVIVAMGTHETDDSYRIRWTAPGVAGKGTVVVLGSKETEKQLRDG